MKCYLDDNLDNDPMVQMGRAHQHDFISPRAIGMRGARDASHLAYAARQAVPIVSRNTGDLEAIHDLALALKGQHFGDHYGLGRT